MKNYQLFHRYVLSFGLTFSPRGFSEEIWQIAYDLMSQAIQYRGPEVTNKLIDACYIGK